jgi:hypothetical protein
MGRAGFGLRAEQWPPTKSDFIREQARRKRGEPCLLSSDPFMLRRFPLFQRLRDNVLALLVDAEGVFNQLTDSDGQWWPFAFLRPDRDEAISTMRVAVLALLQGLPLGLLLVAIDAHARHAATDRRLLGFLAIVCATVFVTNRFTLAYFWNRRAERLGKHRHRLEAWKSGSDGTGARD